MAARFKLVVALLASLLPLLGHAAYAQVSPPAGWSTVGTQGFYDAGSAANGSTYNGRVVANVTANVGGRAVTMPASMRFAANAGQIAMTAIRFNPAMLAASVAASFMLSYGLEYVDEQWKVWREVTVSGVTLYCASVDSYTCTAWSSGDISYTTAWAAHKAYVTANSGAPGAGYTNSWSQCTTSGQAGCGGQVSSSAASVVLRTTSGPGGPYYTTYMIGIRNYTGTTTTEELQPAVPSDFVVPPGDPIPDELPEALPVPLPVEVPVINPSDDAPPVSQPLRVPTGAPQPVPGTDPAEYRQPVVDIVPAPSTQEPWRVDLQPKFIVGEDPSGLTDPAAVESGDPAGTPPPDAQTDCDKYPQASGCKPLGAAPEGPAIPTVSVPLSITPVSGFGASTAACPAPRTVTVAGGLSLAMPFTLLCDYANGIRPVVVGVAWLSAILAFMGLSRRES